MPRFLIIGGTGRIGSLVVKELVANGAEVRILARRPDAVSRRGVKVAGGDHAKLFMPSCV